MTGVVYNGSDLPIYGVVEAFHPSGPHGPVQPPMQPIAKAGAVLRPGEHPISVDLGKVIPSSGWALSIVFKNSGNRYWRRDWNGELAEIDKHGTLFPGLRLPP
jgi:hypothetical protein